jgi:hypothetical protein
MYDTETTTKATDREWVMHARIIRWPDARAHLLPQLLFVRDVISPHTGSPDRLDPRHALIGGACR